MNIHQLQHKKVNRDPSVKLNKQNVPVEKEKTNTVNNDLPIGDQQQPIDAVEDEIKPKTEIKEERLISKRFTGNTTEQNKVTYHLKRPVEKEMENNKSGEFPARPIADKPVVNKTPSTGQNIKKERIVPQGSKTNLVTSAIADEKAIPTDKKENVDSAVVSIPPQPGQNKKSAIPKNSKLSINISFGPDVSAVGTDPGKWRMQYGLGIGYAISKHFGVRAGFYVARKIYSADSNSYHTPFNVINYYYRLDKVNANCLVYEIPVTIMYNFSTSKNHNWFVSTGASTYLMKKEEYDYTYKSSSGQLQKNSYSYKSKNSNIFSVLNFSAGYQYNFNNRFSIITEPYLKIPTTGIGFGKVNLNSAGIMFTIGYKPFNKTQPNKSVIPASNN